MNRDKMYHFTLGFMAAMLVAMIIVSYSPTPETEKACQQCTECWWFSESEEENAK